MQTCDILFDMALKHMDYMKSITKWCLDFTSRPKYLKCINIIYGGTLTPRFLCFRSLFWFLFFENYFYILFSNSFFLGLESILVWEFLCVFLFYWFSCSSITFLFFIHFLTLYPCGLYLGLHFLPVFESCFWVRDRDSWIIKHFEEIFICFFSV